MSEAARRLRVVAVWAALVALPLGVRAEVVPTNPLRGSAAPILTTPRVATTVPSRGQSDPKLPAADSLQALAAAWQDEPHQPAVRLVQATEDLPQPQAPSVVPRSFGEGSGEPYPYDPQSDYQDCPPGDAEDWPGPHPAGRLRELVQSGRWLPTHWFGHSDPNDPYRHMGFGEPLIGTSWRNRPVYLGLFIGGIFNDDLIDHEVLQNNATFLGFRLGWDFDHYWGLEGRYAFARAETLTNAGVPIVEQARDYYGDVSLLYYPWGDSRWRPYFSAGLGLANFRFMNDQGDLINDSAFGMPIGIGIKSYTSNWATLRLDLVDNIAFGTNQISSMHNFSLMAGVEFRFGGCSPSYFPWHGNTTYW
jgi:hypothetical protein